MKDNKGTTVLLTVIGIATLLVAVVGATFAYFSATVKETYTDEDGKDVVVQAATVGTITFTHGYTIDLCDETDESLTFEEGSKCVIYPGAKEAKTFTVAADTASTIPVKYSVYLVIDKNGFTTDNLGYKASVTTTGGTTASVLPTLATDYTSLGNKAVGTEIKLGEATLGTAGAVDTWTLDVQLANLVNENQEADQGKEFSARIVVRATDTYQAATN